MTRYFNNSNPWKKIHFITYATFNILLERIFYKDFNKFFLADRSKSLIRFFRITICSIFFYIFLSITNLQAAVITLSCGPDPGYAGACRELAEEWAEQTGNKIKMMYLPGEANDQLAIYQQLFAAKISTPDVIRVDVIWPGLLHKYLVDLNKYLPQKHIEQHNSSLRDPLIIQNKLVAIPFYNETGILYYRKDLLNKYDRQIPLTWKELEETAIFIMKEEQKSNSQMMGFIWDGRPYEGLTCEALEWIASMGGGKIIEDDGTISVNNPKAIQALEMVKSWVGTISPVETLSERVSPIFTTGNAVFKRGWSGGLGIKPWWSKGRSIISDKVGVAPLPKGMDGKSYGTIGTENLGVSIFSKHKKEAADLVLYLTSRQAQITLAKTASYNPSIPAIYTHPTVMQALPYLQSDVMNSITPIGRPSIITGRRYSKVTKKIWEAVHDILSGKTSGPEGLATLEQDLQKIKREGWPGHTLH